MNKSEAVTSELDAKGAAVRPDHEGRAGVIRRRPILVSLAWSEFDQPRRRLDRHTNMTGARVDREALSGCSSDRSRGRGIGF